jgi:soluble lytic murein transglycosylase-like protein
MSRQRFPLPPFLVGCLLGLAGVAVLFAVGCTPRPVPPRAPEAAAAPAPRPGPIPADAQRWRSQLVRNARLEWGLDAPTSTFAAQVHQESGWRADARSPVGASGMAQFMPATASWISGAYRRLGPEDPTNPVWALRALVVYDRHLWERAQAATGCERMAKTLSGYNGGAKWVARDEVLARQRGLDPGRWFGHVEAVNSGRHAAAWRENRGYPRRILRELEPRYLAAGWGGGSCN